MRKNVLEYKGYMTKVLYDAEEQTLYGKVDGIVDAVTYECTDVTAVEAAFHDSVDRYLAFCEHAGRRPCKAYKGQFNIRIEPSLHRQLAIFAAQNNETMNATVEKAIQAYLETHFDSEMLEEPSRK